MFISLIGINLVNKIPPTSPVCENPKSIHSVSWFILPPPVENYYKTYNASYKMLPPVRKDCNCEADKTEVSMELIYPYYDTKIYIPIGLDGKIGKTIFEAAHRDKDIKIFWFIDENPVGITQNMHQIELNPPVGLHTLTIVDENGEKIVRTFEIIGK